MYLHVPRSYLESIIIEIGPAEVVVVRKTELALSITLSYLVLIHLNNSKYVFNCFTPFVSLVEGSF